MNLSENITRLRVEHGVDLEKTVIYREIKTRNTRVKYIGFALSLPGLLLLTMDSSANTNPRLFLALLILIPAAHILIDTKRVDRDIFRHPDMKRFLKWADYPKYIKAMEAELTSRRSMEVDGAIFTDNFVFQPSYTRLRWFHGSEVCWAFRHVTQQRVFGVMVDTHQVHIYLSDKTTFRLASDEKLKSLRKLTLLAPFAIYGHSKELKKQWQKNKESFIRSVEERKDMYYTNPIDSIE